MNKPKFTEIFCTDTGRGSSKRVAGFVALVVAIAAGLWLDKTVAMDSFLLFAAASFGISGIEKSAALLRNKQNPEHPDSRP